ncbi:hypothetical protein OHS70_17730 [Streptomyces sp. NBC_00390]|uniref:hypothetical protein n=1 Tax=Streptomyces sp. NBC_00390 TaxID=2975736 RepID=UPI002E21FA5C
MKFTSQTDADMEIFLGAVARHLGRIGASAVIDLYADFEISDPEANRLFAGMRQAARTDHDAAGGGRRRGDPWMAVPLDLTTGSGVACFALLAHRTIGCEAVLGGKLVITTVENERIAWVDLPEPDLEDLVSGARRLGATTLSRLV